jgi:hypothetical protein
MSERPPTIRISKRTPVAGPWSSMAISARVEASRKTGTQIASDAPGHTTDGTGEARL